MAKKPDQAALLAQQSQAAVLAEIRRQKAEEARRAAGAQATAAASAKGLQSVLGDIPGRIQGTYKQAGDSTAAYGKGYSTAFTEGSEHVASELNQFLSQQGGPQQVQAAGQAGGDVVYGLGGYIPAAGLAREGAAFSAASEGLGAGALLRGQETQNLIGRESTDKLAQLDALIRGEKAKLPGLTQDYRAQLAEQATKDRAQQLNELLAVENLGIKKGQLGISQQNADTSAASVKLRAAKQRFDQGLANAKLALDGDQLDLAWKREQRLAKSKAKGGFTAKQKQDLSATATASARDAFYGYQDPDSGETVPPRKPVEVLRDLIAAGVPFSLAIRAIQRFGKDPAADQFWRATRKWKKK